MDPYITPKAPSLDQGAGLKNRTALTGGPVGPRCPSCGSYHTSVDSVLKSSPSILAVMFFGWIFMLIRGAFAMRSSMCRDCGELNRYKSTGSWIAMVVLLLLVVMIAVVIIPDFF